MKVETGGPEPTCEHGTALDVHCCGCHSGFLFDINGCTCFDEPARREGETDKLPRVQVVNKKHPHFEEYGRFTGKIITMRFSGEQMAEVALEQCRHGTNGCYVAKGDVVQVPEP